MSPSNKVRGHIWRISGMLMWCNPYRLQGDPPCDCYDRLASEIWAKRYRNAADPRKGIRATILESRPKDLAIETSVLYELALAISRYISLADVPSAEGLEDDPWVRDGIRYYPDDEVFELRPIGDVGDPDEPEKASWFEAGRIATLDGLNEVIAKVKASGPDTGYYKIEGLKLDCPAELPEKLSLEPFWTQEGVTFAEGDIVQAENPDGTWSQVITIRNLSYLSRALYLVKRGTPQAHRIVGPDGKIKYDGWHREGRQFEKYDVCQIFYEDGTWMDYCTIKTVEDLHHAIRLTRGHLFGGHRDRPYRIVGHDAETRGTVVRLAPPPEIQLRFNCQEYEMP